MKTFFKFSGFVLCLIAAFFLGIFFSLKFLPKDPEVHFFLSNSKYFGEHWFDDSFLPKLSEREVPVVVQIPSDASEERSLEILRILRKVGVKEVAFLFSELPSTELANLDEIEQGSAWDFLDELRYRKYDSLGKKHGLINAALEALPFWNFFHARSAGKSGNGFLKKSGYMDWNILPERRERPKGGTFSFYLRFPDSEVVKMRAGKEVLTPDQVEEVLACIEREMKALDFSEPIYIRESWTGRDRYVIAPYGKSRKAVAPPKPLSEYPRHRPEPIDIIY